MVSTPQAPTPPDPAVTANVTGQINADTARLTQRMNLVDQYGPNGSVTYRRIGPDGTGTGVTVGNTGAANPNGTAGGAGSLAYGGGIVRPTGAATNSPITGFGGLDYAGVAAPSTFNAQAYLAANPDVKAWYDSAQSGNQSLYTPGSPFETQVTPEQWAWQHYNTTGRTEGRSWDGAPATGVAATPVNKLDLSKINWASPLNNGVIDPYQGLGGGKAQYDSIRRGVGYTGEFGNNQFENWLKTQDRNTQVGYITQLENNNADPDYLRRLVQQLPGAAGADPYSADNTDRWGQYTDPDPTTLSNLNQQKALTGQLLALASGQAGRVGTALATPLSTDGLPTLSGSVYGDDLGAERTKTESALFDRLQPQLERDRTSLETRLTNMGIPRGSQAWNTAMDDITRQQNDLRLGVTSQGLSEMNGLFGMKMSDAQLANAARSQGLSERAYLTNTPINQITALMAGTQVGLPQGIAPPQVNVNPADYAGNVYNNYNGALSNYNSKVASNNSMFSNLFGLGGTLGAASILSDRRAKKNIRKVGKLDNDLPVYAYKYKAGGPTHIGVMADEAEKKHPSAVHKTPFGLKAVNYDKAVA
jgi:hypothetical protein